MNRQAAASQPARFSAVEQLSSRELEQILSKLTAIQAGRRAPHLTTEGSDIFARINQVLPPGGKRGSGN